MVVDLPEMVPEMGDEMDEPLTGDEAVSRDLLGIDTGHHGIVGLGQSPLGGDYRGLDLGRNLGARDVTPAEFGSPVANVSAATEYRAEEVLDVAAQMERQGLA